MSLKRTCLTLALLSFFFLASNELAHFLIADVYASLAHQKSQANDPAAAERYWRRSLVHVDSSAEYYEMHAQALLARAKRTVDLQETQDLLLQAAERSRKAVALNPREGNAWFILAQTSWWLGKFPGSERELANIEPYFLTALATDPNNGKFLYAVVSCYLHFSKPEQSLPYVQRLATAYPRAYYSLKELPGWGDPLRRQFERGLKMAAGNPLTAEQALGMLGFLASESKDWDSAIAYTEEYIRAAGPDLSSDLYITLGRYCLQRPDYHRARTAFLQALKLSDNRERTLQSILAPCLQANALDLYLDLCREAAVFDTVIRNRLPVILGKALFQGGNMEQALLFFQQSLQTKDTAEARRYLAEIALNQKDWDAAEIQSQRATMLDPKVGHLYYLFARSLEAQSKYKSALEAIGEAIRHAKTPREDYFQMQGSLLWALGDCRGAIEAWKAAHQQAPKNAGTLRSIAEAYRRINDLHHAEQYYVAAVELDPKDATLRSELEAVKLQLRAPLQ